MKYDICEVQVVIPDLSLPQEISPASYSLTGKAGLAASLSVGVRNNYTCRHNHENQ
jgi:hypothetical protein